MPWKAGILPQSVLHTSRISDTTRTDIIIIIIQCLINEYLRPAMWYCMAPSVSPSLPKISYQKLQSFLPNSKKTDGSFLFFFYYRGRSSLPGIYPGPGGALGLGLRPGQDRVHDIIAGAESMPQLRERGKRCQGTHARLLQGIQASAEQELQVRLRADQGP
ncbi:hypothetical protein SAY87_015685 [Trapa incisa]|uniref:Uncharacterized protein n=1 Tax=Trapa incisa TaxID=236973 RepID=A0AAN7L8K5_9MYRT|nr:hypothetical protein SAY87_015685 [Trapa incisa]